jgi:hypothetical protein
MKPTLHTLTGGKSEPDRAAELEKSIRNTIREFSKDQPLTLAMVVGVLAVMQHEFIADARED